MKIITFSILAIGIITSVVYSNKQIVEIRTIGSDQFCMYMAPESHMKNKVIELGVIGCFDGNPHDVNKYNEALTHVIEVHQPTMIKDYNTVPSQNTIATI